MSTHSDPMNVLSHPKSPYDHFDRPDDTLAEEELQEGSIDSPNGINKKSIEGEDSGQAIEHIKEGLDLQGKNSPMDDNLPAKNALSALVDATQTSLPNGVSYLYSYPLYFNPSEAEQQAALVQQQLRYFEGITQLQQLKEAPVPMREEEVYNMPSKRRKTLSYNIPTAASAASSSYGGTHYTGRFMLTEQPNVRQRKSYKNENRYVLPNPLVICSREEGPTEKLPKIQDGIVFVTLVGGDGNELPNKHNILVAPEGGLQLKLDLNLTAQFSLKILDTSEGTLFRLCFTIIYDLEGIGSCEEKVLSRPFQVYSNRKKSKAGVLSPRGTIAREQPVVIDIKPNEGLATEETEVWIKGRSFSDTVNVLFGDKPAKITEQAPNFISVLAPPAYEVISDTPVQVVVINQYGQDGIEAEKRATYTYYVDQ